MSRQCAILGVVTMLDSCYVTSMWQTVCCDHTGFLPFHVNVADWVLWPYWILVMSRQCSRLSVVAMLDSCYVTSLWHGRLGVVAILDSCHFTSMWQTGCCGHAGFLPFHVNVADWVL